MADGIDDYAEMRARRATAVSKRAEMDRGMEEAEIAPAVALHRACESSRRHVEKLTQALNAPEMEAGESRHALRTLIELIAASPRDRGPDLLVHGRLAWICT